MNTARIRRTEKMMVALDPTTRVRRYWDALSAGNGQAERLLATMPDKQRQAFRRGAMATAIVVRVLPMAENLLLRVQKHVLIAALPRPMTDPEFEAWLNKVRGLWAELLAFEQFRERAVMLAGARTEPIRAMTIILKESRTTLLDVKKMLPAELKGMEKADANHELAATLVRLFVA